MDLPELSELLLTRVGPVFITAPFFVGWRKPERYAAVAHFAGAIAIWLAATVEFAILAFEHGQDLLIRQAGHSLERVPPDIDLPTGTLLGISLCYVVLLMLFDNLILQDG